MSRPRLVTGAVTAGIFHFCSAEDQILIPSDPYLSFHIKINGLSCVRHRERSLNPWSIDLRREAHHFHKRSEVFPFEFNYFEVKLSEIV